MAELNEYQKLRNALIRKNVAEERILKGVEGEKEQDMAFWEYRMAMKDVMWEAGIRGLSLDGSFMRQPGFMKQIAKNAD